MRNWNIKGSAIALATSVLLLGATASLGVAGIQLNLSNVLDSPFAPHVRAGHWLPLAIMLPAAMGCICAVRLNTRAGMRKPADGSTTISYAGLVTGLYMAILPFLLYWAGKFSGWIHAHFTLSNWPVRFLQLGLMLLVCALPLLGLGFTAQLLYARNSWNRVGSRRVLGHAMALGAPAGLGMGILAAWLMADRPASLLPAASLPLLLLAIITVKLPVSAQLPTASNEV